MIKTITQTVVVCDLCGEPFGGSCRVVQRICIVCGCVFCSGCSAEKLPSISLFNKTPFDNEVCRNCGDNDEVKKITADSMSLWHKHRALEASELKKSGEQKR